MATLGVLASAAVMIDPQEHNYRPKRRKRVAIRISSRAASFGAGHGLPRRRDYDSSGPYSPRAESRPMFPIGDDTSQRRTVPVVTYILVGLNVLMFLLELSAGDSFILRWAFIPANFAADPAGNFITIFTAM